MASGPLDARARGAGLNPEQAGDAIARLAGELNKVISAGDTARGAQLADEVCTIIRQTWPDTPHATFASYFELAGVLHVKNGDMGKAEWSLREALHMQRALHGKDDPAIVPTLCHLGEIATKTGRLDEAAALLLEARDIIERTGTQPESDLVYQLSQLAVAFRDQNKRDRGTRILEAAEHLARVSGDQTVIMSAQLNLATFYEESGRHAEAIPFVENTLAFIRTNIDHVLAAGGQNRASAEAEFGVAAFLSRLGKDHLAAGAPRRAIPLFEEAIAMRTREHGEKHPEVGRTIALLAEACEAAGDEMRAGPLYRKAAAILEHVP